MKKRLMVILLLLVGATARVSAQGYNWSLGVRGGETATGIVGKFNLNPTNSFEAIVDFTRGFNVYGLYERHVPVIGEGFRFYYGAGANVGSWRRSSENKFTIGANGIIGLEYKINSVPLAFSLDYKPNLNITGHTGFNAWDFGLGIRVTF